jgi:chorismate-pyruvate lyase
MPDPSITPATAVPYAYPLDDFYASAGLKLPDIERVNAEELPEPYRGLLAHQSDMTPTLEKFYGAEVHLRILRRDQRNGFYFREVVLCLEGSEKAVEFGAIKINLGPLPPRARQLVLEAHVPFGRVLKDCSVRHSTQAKAFFRLHSDEFISKALGMPQSKMLYGRRATIFDSKQRPLSEVVEILPPAATTPNP